MQKYERQLRKLAKRFDRELIVDRKHYHLKCIHGEYRLVVTSKTPSDHRVLKNLEKELQRVHEGRDEPQD